MARACLLTQETAKLAGYHSPTSWESLEKNYAPPSEDWYSESPPRKSLSPTTKKTYHEELEANINLDALSSQSSDSYVWGPIGKTPEEIAAWCAEYERGHRREMTNCCRLGNAGIYRASTESCIHRCVACSNPSYSCKRVYSTDPRLQAEQGLCAALDSGRRRYHVKQGKPMLHSERDRCTAGVFYNGAFLH
jgi:hypothetical protein